MSTERPSDPPIDPEELKYAGMTPEHIRAIQEKNYQTSLKVWWARDFGFLALLDPFTGEVYEVERTKETPKWLTWRAMEEKNRRRSAASSATRWRGSSG